MTIAELFVSIGIKGEGSAKKALQGTKSQLGEVASAGLAAKAAIVAAIYGLEQLMSHSAQAGTALTNFTALTGISNQELQKWQFAGQQAGESFDEVASSIKNVQAQMQAIKSGGGPSGAFGTIAQYLPGGIDENKAFKDPLYMMKKLQEFSQLKTLPEAFKNQWLSAFVSEGTQAAMKRNAFTQANFDKAPAYSDKEAKSLDRINVAWKNIGTTIEMAMGHLTSRHGAQFVKEIEHITTSVAHLVDVLLTLSEQLGVFSKIAKVFDFANAGLGKVEGVADNAKKGNIGSALAGAWKLGQMVTPFGAAMTAYDVFKGKGTAAAPLMKPTSGGSTHISAPQNVTIIGQKNPNEISHEIKKHHQTNINRAASGIQKRVN